VATVAPDDNDDSPCVYFRSLGKYSLSPYATDSNFMFLVGRYNYHFPIIPPAMSKTSTASSCLFPAPRAPSTLSLLNSPHTLTSLSRRLLPLERLSLPTVRILRETVSAMVNYEDMSDRARLKYGTERVERYLISTAKNIVGDLAWINVCGPAHTATPPVDMPIQVFSRCGQIIANDPTEAELIPNHILNYLRDVIPLRDAEIAVWRPLATHNAEVQETVDKHVAFNAVLKDILRMFNSALNRFTSLNFSGNMVAPPITPQTSDASMEGTSQDHANFEPGSPNTDSKITSEVNGEAPEMDVTTTDIDHDAVSLTLTYAQTTLLLSEDVLEVWRDFQNLLISASASGSITAFAYHLIKRDTSRFEVTNQIASVAIGSLPDSGLLSNLLSFYQDLLNQMADVEDEVLDHQARIRTIAKTLFMPTVAAYLIMWARKTDKFKQIIVGTDSMPAFPSTTAWIGRLDPAQWPQALAIDTYAWEYDAALHILRIMRRMGSLEKICGRRCYPVADPLTRSLPPQLWEEDVAPWQAIALDLLLRVLTSLNAGNDPLRHGKDLISLGDYAVEEIDMWIKHRQSTTPEFEAAKVLVNSLVKKDPLAQMGHQLNYIPPTFFLMHYNPPLNGVISHTILAELDRGVAATEAMEPVATAIAILYRALFGIGKLRVAWHDMEALISFYGQEAIFHQSESPTTLQDFYKRSKAVLGGAPRTFLQPTKFQQLVYKYHHDCSTDNFRELLSFVETYLNEQDTAEKEPKKKHADGIYDTSFAYALHLWETDAEEYRAIETPPSPQPGSPDSLKVESGTPTCFLFDDEDEPDSTSDNQELDSRELLQGFVQLTQAQDLVAHMNKPTFWLECHDMAAYVKRVYIEYTGAEPFPDEAHTYTYIPLFLEYLHRNPAEGDQLLDPVVEVFEDYIRWKGRDHVKVATELSGADRREGW